MSETTDKAQAAPVGAADPNAEATAQYAATPAADAQTEQTVEQVLGSVHTSNFPDLLRELGGCLIVSTYQAGKLVILRPDANSINTHFRTFNRPMGMAADRQRLMLGVRLLIAGDAAAGLQEFLHILQTQRDWNDGAAKKRLIAAFGVLDDEELVGSSRRRMASLLF